MNDRTHLLLFVLLLILAVSYCYVLLSLIDRVEALEEAVLFNVKAIDQISDILLYMSRSRSFTPYEQGQSEEYSL